MRSLVVTNLDTMLTTAVKTPQMFCSAKRAQRHTKTGQEDVPVRDAVLAIRTDPKTTAPVYLNGSLAARP